MIAKGKTHGDVGLDSKLGVCKAASLSGFEVVDVGVGIRKMFWATVGWLGSQILDPVVAIASKRA